MMTPRSSASLRLHPSVDLTELDAVAELQTRVDRKYVIPTSTAEELVACLHPDVAVLRIDDRQAFEYESMYFDTSDLQAYRAAARGRPSRFKVRIRTYRDSELCMLEVKCRDGRSATVKHRTEHPLNANTRLTGPATRFVEAAASLPIATQLAPTITTIFRRTTLLDRREGSRTTIDRELQWRSSDGRVITMPSHIVIETKTLGPVTAIDRWLWRHGHRPERMSKYCVGMALHDPSLPAHRWNRLLRTTFGWMPDRSSSRENPMQTMVDPLPVRSQQA